MNNQLTQTIAFMVLVGIAVITAFHYTGLIAAKLPNPWDTYLT